MRLRKEWCNWMMQLTTVDATETRVMQLISKWCYWGMSDMTDARMMQLKQGLYDWSRCDVIDVGMIQLRQQWCDYGRTLWARIIMKPDWNIRPLACPFTCTTHSFVCSALHTTHLARALRCTYSIACSLCSLPRSWDSEWFNGYIFCFFYSGP